MTREDIIKRLKSNIQFERYPQPVNSGGQSCGVMVQQGCKLTCPETEFVIIITHFRSQLLNRELAFELYSQFLDKII